MSSAVSGLSAALYQDEGEEYVVTPALGSNRDICFVSKNHATNKVEIVVSGNNTPLSVSAAAPKLTINSATDGSGNATSTAAAIVAAVNADAGAFALFEARLPPGSTGAGVTGALAETTAHDGLAFTGLALVDSGDGLTWQAAAGSRYWDPDVPVTVYDDGVEVTEGYTVNYLRGSVTFDTAVAGTITVDGTRRSELALEKVLMLYDGKLKIEGKEIDTSNVDDSGWGSSIAGARTWELTANAFYYAGDVAISGIGVDYIWKFYSIDATSDSFVGHGSIQVMDYISANPDKAQERNITVKGRGELYPEA